MMAADMPKALTPHRRQPLLQSERKTSGLSGKRTRKTQDVNAGAAPGLDGGDKIAEHKAATFVANKPQARRTPQTSVDLTSLAQHLQQRPGLGLDGKAPAALSVLDEHALTSSEPGVRHALVTVEARFDDGTKERYLLPLRIDAKGKVSDGLTSDAFKKALMDGVARGESFEPALEAPARRTARRRPGGDGVIRQGALSGGVGARLHKADVDRKATQVLEGGAYDAHVEAAALARAVYGDANDTARARNPWAALVDKGYTSRARYEHVVEQAKKLSPKNADALIVEFFKAVYQTLEAQPAEVKEFHEALRTQPRFGPVFYGYAQFIGVPDGKSEATFDDLAHALDVIQGPAAPLSSMVRGAKATGAGKHDGDAARGFGFREIELLPFFESPQKDGGYDISNHAEVDPARGGTEAYGRFMGAAVDRGMRVTADLVANHVSNEHAWAKALVAGDTSMLSRFVVWDDAQKIGERVVDGKTFNVFLHMKGENAGKISHVWQIFPDNNPDTFIKAASSDGEHNIFASFMNPFQWDVNAEDPAVLADYLHTIGKFANMGQMGTRMDAIIHMGKRPGTFNMNLPESQAFMALSKAFAAHVAPGNMFLPEANLPWDEARKDWLAPEKTFGGKIENTAGDALISFDVHRAIWDSLLKEDKSAWVEEQASLGELPAHKSLLVYLGLHDETLIRDPELRRALVQRGFHEFAGRGVGDAPATLLDGSADRLAMAHVLLYSSKGHPAVYYRTVVGEQNDYGYFEQKTKDRLAAQKAAGETPDPQKARDTRDLDRGPVPLSAFEKALGDGYKPAVTVRALNALWDNNGSVRSNRVVEVKNPDAGVVSFARTSADTDDAPLLQLINLTGDDKTVVLPRAEVEEKLGWDGVTRLHDLLQGEIDGKERDVPFAVHGDRIELRLAPYEAMYLERA